jgi:hypothetical protein
MLAGRSLREKLLEPVEIADAPLEFQEGSEFRQYQVLVQRILLTLDDSGDINPVLVPSGEDLVHDQVLAAAGA